MKILKIIIWPHFLTHQQSPFLAAYWGINGVVRHNPQWPEVDWPRKENVGASSCSIPEWTETRSGYSDMDGYFSRGSASCPLVLVIQTAGVAVPEYSYMEGLTKNATFLVWTFPLLQQSRTTYQMCPFEQALLEQLVGLQDQSKWAGWSQPKRRQDTTINRTCTLSWATGMR